MIGDTLHYFEEGDLVLLGANIPHTWVSQENSSAIVMQFSQAFIDSFLHLEEFKNIKALLEKAQNGLFFPEKEDIVDLIRALPAQEGVRQVLALLALLHQLSDMPAQGITSQTHFSLNQQTETRINKVCRYIQENHEKPLDLQTLAALIYLSESAFCKFFKKTTGKTFSEYLNFIRIQAVCRALQETDKTILTIAFEKGFESLTYFNRVFKREKGISPKTFRDFQSAKPLSK